MVKSIIKQASDLITTREQTRAGFINFALEKNKRSTPIVESAKSLKVLASRASTPKALLKITDIRPALLTAAGLSEKAVSYFTETDKDVAINELGMNYATEDQIVYYKVENNNYMDQYSDIPQ